MIKEYEGVFCKNCYAMGGRINFQSDGISLCHSLEGKDPYLKFQYGEDNVATCYLRGIKKILDDVNSGTACECDNCSILKNSVFNNNKIFVITINTSSKCNSRCLYCCSHDKEGNLSIDLVPYFKQLEELNLISTNCFFDYGGGEPTLDPFFKTNIQYISDRNYMLRVNTNAFDMSEYLKDIISKHKDYYVRVSIDAGTSLTYKRMKGADKYYDVWNNVEEYMSVSDKVMIKYVLCQMNCSRENIEGFIDSCRTHCVKEVYIDVDHDAYAVSENSGWSIYTKDIFDSAWYMKEIAEQNGIVPKIGYVWTARNVNQETFDYNIVKRDRKGCRFLTSVKEIQLPDEYIDNTNKQRKEYKIVYEKFNDLDELLNSVNLKRIVLYGVGKNGTKLLSHLKKKDIIPIGVSDSNADLIGTLWNGFVVEALFELHKKLDTFDVIITPAAADEIVRNFNQEENIYNFLESHLYYISGQDY